MVSVVPVLLCTVLGDVISFGTMAREIKWELEGLRWSWRRLDDDCCGTIRADVGPRC